MMGNNILIGRKIEKLLRDNNMTKQELCERAKIGRVTLHRIMTGHHNPTMKTLENIAIGLGVPVSELLGHDNNSYSRAGFHKSENYDI